MSKNATAAVFSIVLVLAGCKKASEGRVLDCKEDLDCFIQAAQSCRPARVVHTATVDTFGVKQTTQSTFEIRGPADANRCTFYLRTDKIDATFPPAIPAEAVNKSREAFKTREGRDATCKFNAGDLAAMLTRWKQGRRSTEDWKVADCQGSFFEQPGRQSQ